MSIADMIAAELPYLRRYARALTGSQNSGDAFVRATLEAALADSELRATLSAGRVQLYSAFNRIWTSGSTQSVEPVSADGLQERNVHDQLARITPRHRQALLLTTLEEFSLEEAGAILGISDDEVAELVAEAIAEIEGGSAARVLIIEDEPLISLQLESIVADLGHEVVGSATTRSEARDAFTRAPASLILADIQLADGSSGIDAVEDIMAIADVPVIFITAYPERLLTGERPEPTYLVTKPFREDTVRAAISQALFFRNTQPIG